jgi:hypothetical protein
MMILPLLAFAAALAVAACGSSSPSSSGSALTSSRYNSALKFAQCMRANGVSNFPDPSQTSGSGIQIQASQGPNGQTLKVNGTSVDAPAFQSAQTKCQKYMPQGPALSSSQLAKVRQNVLKMAECMRSHGVPNFPDPTVSTGPGGHGVGIQIGGGGVDPKSPAFLAAQKICGGPGAITPGVVRKAPGATGASSGSSQAASGG